MLKNDMDHFIKEAEDKAMHASAVAEQKAREKAITAATIGDWLEHPAAEIFLTYLKELTEGVQHTDIMSLDLSGDNQHLVLQLLGRRLKVELINRDIIGWFKKQKQKAEQLIKEETK